MSQVTTKREQLLLRQSGWEWDRSPLPRELIEYRWVNPAGQRCTDRQAKEVVTLMLGKRK